MIDIRRYRDMLLGAQQLDLSSLERGRLEELCESLIEGQLVICEAFAHETRQSHVIEAQTAMITRLNESVATANSALANLDDNPIKEVFKDILVSMAHHVAEHWGADRSLAIDGMMTGVYRGLQAVTQYDGDGYDTVRQWWETYMASPSQVKADPQ